MIGHYNPIGVNVDLLGNPRNNNNIVDIGAYEYTKATLSKNAGSTLLKATLFPNPAKNKATLKYNLGEAKDITIDVIDIAGKIMYTYNEKQTPGNFYHVINFPDFMLDGIYFIHLKATNEPQKTLKLVVER
jgi:hypothetical protein